MRLRKRIKARLQRSSLLEKARARLELDGEFVAGHYHSPTPSREQIEAFLADERPAPLTLPDVDLRPGEQRALLEAYQAHLAGAPWTERPTGDLRYGYDNIWFGYGDAVLLYAFLRHHRPARVVEVGSGWSSAAVLDTADAAPDWRPALRFIDPNPQRLRGLLRPTDDAEVHEVRVQDVPLAVFEELDDGDLLFIDSSHVMKLGSDLHFLFFEVLPRLRPGVFVHFHDVFHPFEYPKRWIEAGRYWNEAYVLRAFLAHNDAWRVVFFNSWAAQALPELLDERARSGPGGGLYLQRSPAQPRGAR